ncbi:hypothetical protein LPC10_17350 [Methylorubrum sp. B1-46]|jgi:hypothetical protein|uniref:hypothetical protein n=1 Tax=Methylorubrum sp. B1-46 TaxID=2897334 RepID=UPI001E3828A8|nr:hypothetical protein [Methylorubrum sp. B1-46]UGB24702.1 hypothetical protein LPC10_17350 [Methylorubrum sp. B1-46]
MALTDRDIVLFARDTVFEGATSDAAKNVCARNALACYEAAQQAVRESGYRVTQRVKDGIWAELQRLSSFRMAA